MGVKSRNGGRAFTLRPRPPLDAGLTLGRYRLWGEDPTTIYRDGALYRLARVDGRLVPFRVAAAGPREHPVVRVDFAGPDAPAVRAVLRRQTRWLLGLDVDLAGFYRRAARDRVLAPLLQALRGLRPTLAPDPFEMLVGTITAQQVHLAFATAVRGRLVRAFGEPREFGGVRVYAFPAPAVLAAADPAALRGLQLTTRKAESIVELARAVAGGQLDLAALARAPDAAVVARLSRIRGLGRWTAEWFLLRGLGRLDVCPAEDLGVRRAVAALCFRGRPVDADAVRRRVAGWRPYRGLATHYLLAAVSRPAPGRELPATGPAAGTPSARAAGRGPSRLAGPGVDGPRPAAAERPGRPARSSAGPADAHAAEAPTAYPPAGPPGAPADATARPVSGPGVAAASAVGEGWPERRAARAAPGAAPPGGSPP